MKAIQEPQVLVRSGVQRSTECGMVVNAKAFEMLARQYSDPIKAILQEISANAADSHIRAGIPERPFDVKLPNSIDPHFRVRDYGVSMTQEVIYDVYINYMKSDKTNTNDETGFFGIGSKTPLSYTDSFNVKTYLDGKMHLYTLGYNENNIPELNEFAAHETDEENGVEISFAVKPEDFSKFSDKASHIYSFFTVPPTIAGVASFATKTFTKLLEGTNWFMFKDSRHDDSYVVMGNIAYPLSDEDIDVSYSSDYYNMINGGIVLEVPMGTVSMTPSREALEYNDTTIAYIKSRLDVVKKEMGHSVKVQIDNCSNLWQARLKAKELGRSLGWRCSQLIDLDKWRGQDIPSIIDIAVDRKYFIETGRYGGAGNNKVRCRKQNIERRISISEDTVVVIKDTTTKFDSRCRFLCAENPDKTVYLIEYDSNESDLRKLFNCGDADIIFYSSQLPDPPKNPNKRSYTGIHRKTTTSVMKFHPNKDATYRRNYESQYWSEDEIDLKEDPSTTHVYVEWYNYEYSSNGRNYNIINILRLLNRVSIGLPPNFYGVKTAQMNKVSKCANWIPFHTWVRSQIEKAYDNEEFREKVAFNKSLKDIEMEDEICQLMQYKTADFIDKESDFVQFANFVMTYGERTRRRDTLNKDDQRADYSSVREVASLCDYDLKLNNVIGGDKGNELFKKVEQKYPLVVAFMKRNYYTYVKDHADAIVCTVNAIDSYLN